MQDREPEQHLSEIATLWTVLAQVHQGAGDEAAAAHQMLLRRYCGAVYRYLLAAVREPDLAMDLTQEFALRFLQGRFRNADRSQGRFRNYVKASLFRLVGDHRRSQFKGPRSVPLEDDAHAAPDESEAENQAFCESWRQELLARAWKALAAAQQEAGQPYHDVLRLRADQPDLSSAQMAELLSTRLHRPFTAAGIRQLLHRARERFAELLLDDVHHSMGNATHDQIVEELADLNLLKYCQDILARRQADQQGR